MAIFSPTPIDVPAEVPGIGPEIPVVNANLVNSIKILNASWDLAAQALNAFDGTLDSAKNTATNIGAFLVTPNSVTSVDVQEPTFTIPVSIPRDDTVFDKYDQKTKEYIELLAAKFVEFQGTYFSPIPTTAGWLSSAMGNADSAIPPGVAAQIVTGAKNRAYANAASQSDAVIARFAAMRFPLPPGAVADAVAQLSKKAHDTVAETEIALTAKYVENMQFAVSQANQLREGTLRSAIGYISALVSGPNGVVNALELSTNQGSKLYDAQSKMISASAGYFNARTDAARLGKQVDQFNVTTDVEADKKNSDIHTTSVQEQVKLMLVEAQALAQIATSLFNNLHVSTSISTTANA